MKAFNLPIDYVLYDISYANLMLYGASLPTYQPNKEKGKEDKDEVINGDDPNSIDKIIAMFDE